MSGMLKGRGAREAENIIAPDSLTLQSVSHGAVKSGLVQKMNLEGEISQNRKFHLAKRDQTKHPDLVSSESRVRFLPRSEPFPQAGEVMPGPRACLRIPDVEPH